jgi:membrane protein implicated in regulation of membrane protease activity
MNRQFEISFLSPGSNPSPGLPERKRSFFNRVRLLMAGIATAILVLAIIVAAVILGSVIAVAVGLLLAVVLIVVIIRVMLQRARQQRLSSHDRSKPIAPEKADRQGVGGRLPPSVL